jgi:hypothetical protein
MDWASQKCCGWVICSWQEATGRFRLNILDQKAVYEDNYFDLPAGAVKQVRMRLPAAARVEDRLLYIECENQPRIVKSLAQLH